MDPSAAALILAALQSGATTGAQSVASEAIKDAYKGLKGLISNRIANHPKMLQTLAEYEEDPDTYEKPLLKTIQLEQLDQDPDIIQAARDFLALANPQQAAMGKYNVQVTGDIHGYAQGDHQNVTMNFGHDTSKEK